MRNRQEEIRSKGFDMINSRRGYEGPIDYGKIKVGTKTLDDAVLNLAVKNGKLLANQLSNLFVWDISNISPEKYTEVQLQSLRNIFNFNKSYFKEFNEDFHPFLMPNDELWVGYYDSIIIFKPNRDFTKWQTSYTPYSNFEGSGKISCILSDIIDKNTFLQSYSQKTKNHPHFTKIYSKKKSFYLQVKVLKISEYLLVLVLVKLSPIVSK